MHEGLEDDLARSLQPLQGFGTVPDKTAEFNWH